MCSIINVHMHVDIKQLLDITFSPKKNFSHF